LYDAESVPYIVGSIRGLHYAFLYGTASVPYIVGNIRGLHYAFLYGTDSVPYIFHYITTQHSSRKLGNAEEQPTRPEPAQARKGAKHRAAPLSASSLERKILATGKKTRALQFCVLPLAVKTFR
jgi:hypothetical protein